MLKFKNKGKKGGKDIIASGKFILICETLGDAMVKKDKANMINRQTVKQWYTKTQHIKLKTEQHELQLRMIDLRCFEGESRHMWHLSCCSYGKDLFTKWDDVFNIYQSRLCSLGHPENSLCIRFIMNLNRISK